jgi:hypothetical protein
MQNRLRAFDYFIPCLLLLSVQSHALDTPFSGKDFSKVKDVICDPQTVEDLKAIGRQCGLDNFTIQAEDLNGDGNKEWIFYGPEGECGAHGNCPVKIFTKREGKFIQLNKDCQGERCLTWGNAYASTVLKNIHQGYRDLQIASDSGSFYWTKDIYQWDGHAYQMVPGSTTYYLYNSDVGKLKQVSQKQFESCAKTGKGCL